MDEGLQQRHAFEYTWSQVEANKNPPLSQERQTFYSLKSRKKPQKHIMIEDQHDTLYSHRSNKKVSTYQYTVVLRAPC